MEAAPRDKQSILVVDDNEGARYAVARGLKANGFKVVEAPAGASALELAEFVSAVVLDIHLPDVDGFEVSRLLRRNASTVGLPIVHVSAVQDSAEVGRQSEEAGGNGFFAAPVDMRGLVKMLDGLISQRGDGSSYTPLRALTQDAAAHDQGPGERSGSGSQSVLEQMTGREKIPPSAFDAR